MSAIALDDDGFQEAWSEGNGLSAEEAIAYAQRGRGERKRPSSGWESLTPAERDVVRLVSDGLANKDVATRLFISPRTVQTHLTHVYTKLGLVAGAAGAGGSAPHLTASQSEQTQRALIRATSGPLRLTGLGLADCNP